MKDWMLLVLVLSVLSGSLNFTFGRKEATKERTLSTFSTPINPVPTKGGSSSLLWVIVFPSWDTVLPNIVLWNGAGTLVVPSARAAETNSLSLSTCMSSP